MMTELKLPELPPRYKWWIGPNEEITIKAMGTVWGDEEHIFYTKADNKGKYLAQAWLKSNKNHAGIWEVMQVCDTKQEAVNWMSAALMLGMADYTLLEE
jgi:hypothetical protein